MRKLSLFIIAAFTALTACQKAEESAKLVGRPMTLSATIGDPDSKITFTDESNALKASWDAEESISVLTLSSDNNYTAKVLSVDKFTSSGAAGRKTAEFTGTFTGGESPAKVICLYPALEETSPGSKEWVAAATDNPYQKTIYNICSDGSESGLYWRANSYSTVYNTSDGNTSHIASRNVLRGDATISGSSLSVSLRSIYSALRLNLTMDGIDVNANIGELTIKMLNSDGSDGKLFVAGWGYINQDSAPSSGSSPSNAQYLYLGPYGSMSVNLGGEEYLYGIYD
jgi:hypothetical protein